MDMHGLEIIKGMNARAQRDEMSSNEFEGHMENLENIISPNNLCLELASAINEFVERAQRDGIENTHLVAATIHIPPELLQRMRSIGIEGRAASVAISALFRDFIHRNVQAQELASRLFEERAAEMHSADKGTIH